MKRVADWDEWQTYRKDRGQPPWIKVYRRLLRNLDWLKLSDVQRGHLVQIWLLAADHDGEIPDNPDDIKLLCHMGTLPDLQLLTQLGFIERDANSTPVGCQVDANSTPQVSSDQVSSDQVSSEADNPSNPGTDSTAPLLVDPLEQYPVILAGCSRMIDVFHAAHPKVKIPKPNTKAWRDWRGALAKLVRIDKYSENEVVDVFIWLFTSVKSEAEFWRKQVRSFIPLRNEIKTGGTKFNAIYEEWEKSRGVTHRAAAHKASVSDGLTRKLAPWAAKGVSQEILDSIQQTPDGHYTFDGAGGASQEIEEIVFKACRNAGIDLSKLIASP